MLFIVFCTCIGALCAENHGVNTSTVVADRDTDAFADYPAQSKHAGSTYLPLDDPAYELADRLIALGYAPTAVADSRPWTRTECRRIAELAVDRLEGESNEAAKLAAALLARCNVETSRPGAAVDRIYLHAGGITGPVLRDSYHFGQTFVDDNGRPYGNGANMQIGMAVRANAGPFAAYVSGEFQQAGSATSYSPSTARVVGCVDNPGPCLPGVGYFNAVARGRLQEAYVSGNLGGLQISVGQQSLWWGPGRSSAMLFSNNADPMLMLRAAPTAPIGLPGFLSRFGYVTGEFFFARMSGHLYPVDAYIHGQKIVLKPTQNLELGFSRTVIFGGHGYPQTASHPVTFGSFWDSFWSVGNKIADTPGSATDLGDRRGGFDFRYRLPKLRDRVTLYADAMTDDDPSPLSAPRRAAYTPGIYISRLPWAPKLDLRVETPFTSVGATQNGGRYFYFNGGYHDAYTNNANLIGSWVGRDGQGVMVATTYWHSPTLRFKGEVRDHIVEDAMLPGGMRSRQFTGGADWEPKSPFSASIRISVQRWRAPLLAAQPQTNAAAFLQLVYRPRFGGRRGK